MICRNNIKNEELEKGETVIYKAQGRPLIDLRLQQETVWLTQREALLRSIYAIFQYVIKKGKAR